jgi:ethanolamine ammonia-lyase small subunit
MSDQSCNSTPQLIPADPFTATNQALAARLRAITPARVGLRRSGSSIATSEVLDFQLAHGRARDAVHAVLQPTGLLSALHKLNLPEALLLHSSAKDRGAYLQRPDLGRTLDAASRQRLVEFSANNHGSFDLAIVIADGLSALAVERHALPLLAELLPILEQSSLHLHAAPVCIVEQGRVAVGDEIAQLLSASLVVILIGERPGLSSPDSLGAYITWNPRPGRTTDAERNCISNIRTEGLSYAQATSRLLYYINEARSKRLTGVALKDPDAAMLQNAIETRSEA